MTSTGIAVVAFIVGLAVVVPPPLLATWGGEFWWPIALHVAFLRGFEWGRDIVFTYGPLGLLAEGYHSETYAAVLVARALLVSLTLVALWLAGTRRTDGVDVSVRTVVLLVAMPIVVHAALNSTFFLWFPMLLLIVGLDDERSGRRGLVVLSLAGAVLSLVKFSYGVMISFVMVIVAMRDASARQKPIPAAVYAATVLMLWLVSGQSLSGLPRWISGSVEVASGYAASQGRDRDVFGMDPQRLLLWYLASLMLFLVASTLLEFSRSRAVGLAHMFGWSGLGFLLLKAGFVRADEWHVGPTVGALVLGQLTWFLLRGLRKIDGRLQQTEAMLALCSLFVSLGLLNAYARDGLVGAVPETAKTAMRNVVEMLSPSGMRAAREEEWRGAIAAENREGRLPLLPGTVDAYPSPLGALFHPDATYSPRPVIRSVETFSPSLAQRNVRHLEESPAERVLFRIEPKDERLPSLEESESWPLLWARYAIEARHGKTLVLRLRPSYSRYRMTEILTVKTSIGQTIVLPRSDAPLFASFEVEPSFAGRLRSVLYRTQHLTIDAQLGAGKRRSFRFVPLMACKPIMISPLIEGVDEWQASMRGRSGSEQPQVTAVTLNEMPSAWPRLWTGQVKVTLYRLEGVPRTDQRDETE